MSNDTAGHPQVDFVWGNVPMQPNDERGANVLDPLLDSHEIVYNNWNGFPAYVPNTVDGGGYGGSGSGSGSSSGSGSGSAPAPEALLGPTTSWYHSMGNTHFPGYNMLHPLIQGNPSLHKVVVTGGNYPGEYNIANAYIDMMYNHVVVTYYGGGPGGSMTMMNGAGAAGQTPTTDDGVFSIVAM